MATLNYYADQLLNLLGRHTDFELRERLKALIKQERALLLRRTTEQNGIDQQYVQDYNAELIKVDLADSCLIEVGCNMLRTINKIPTPIRYKTDIPFVFIGSLDGRKAFTYTRSFELEFTNSLKYANHLIRYDYINSYVYIFNNTKLKYIKIRAMYGSPDLVTIQETGDNCTGICYDDSVMEFPITEDMISIIFSTLLNGALKLEFGNKKVPESVNETPLDKTT